MQSLCIICGSGLEQSPGGDAHFLNSFGIAPTKEEKEESSYLFRLFCEHMAINSEQSKRCAWDFSKELLPFCRACKDIVCYMSELDKQLQNIRNEIHSTVDALLSKAKSAEEDTTKFSSAADGKIHRRTMDFRQLILRRAAGDEDESSKKRQRTSPTDKSPSDWSGEEEDASDTEMKGDDKESDEEYKPSKTVERIYNKSNADAGQKGRLPSRPVIALEDGVFEYAGLKFMETNEGFVCCTCTDKLLKTKGGMLNHLRHSHLHEKPQRECPICGKLWDSPSALRMHISHHSDVRNHVCHLCGKGFKNTKNLRDHMKMTHKMDVKHLCLKCNMKMSSTEELNRHLKSEHCGAVQPFCDSCGRVFSSEAQLQDHIESHRGQKYFKCYYCNSHYLQKLNLKEHFCKEHGVKVEASGADFEGIDSSTSN